jgi:hypothetical protein
MATQELGKSTYGMLLCKKSAKDWKIFDGLAGNRRRGSSYKQGLKFRRILTAQIRKSVAKTTLKLDVTEH